MSEKRFELRSYGNDDEIWEMKDKQGESLLTWEDIEKKLNQLSEENEELRQKAQIVVDEMYAPTISLPRMGKKIKSLEMVLNE